MILDKDLQLSSAQTLTSGGADASTNYIDGLVASELGVGTPLYVVVSLSAAMAGAGTCVVTVETDDNASFTSPTTAQTIGTFAAASAAGSKLTATIQPAVNERYFRLKYTNGTLTAGSVSAHLALGVDQTKHYADAITIS